MTELILKSPIMLGWWAVQIAIKLPVVILGFALQPLMFKHRNVLLKDMPWYLLWLTNPEDQPGGYPGFPDSFPPFWHRKMEAEGWSLRYAHYHYHAVRNPGDGLRNFKFLQVVPKPDEIKYVTNKYLRHYEPRALENGETAYYFCWQGFSLGMHIVHVWSDERYLTFKFGFRIHPADSIPGTLDPKGTRAQLGASMATKFLPYRKWNR
jgi:hypothetical protein